MKNYFLRIIQFSEKIYKNILALNFLDPKLTRAKLFETERTRRLACLPSFCELVSIVFLYFLLAFRFSRGMPEKLKTIILTSAKILSQKNVFCL